MNYTVLVVDDETDQRRALVSRVEWQKAGFEVVGEAENGIEALDLMDTLEPDLVMTDIKMPMMTGLELASKIHEERPATQVVILSGYDSFDYARKAINYNIISYLLKPISSAELSEELFNIKKRMDERLNIITSEPDESSQSVSRRLYVDEFLFPLMLGSSETQPNNDELTAKAKELGIIRPDQKDIRFTVMVSKFRNDKGYCTDARHTEFIKTIMSKYTQSESFIAFGRIVTLIVPDSGEAVSNLLELPLKEIVQTAKRVLGEKCTIGLSREFNDLSLASEAYFQAINARRYTSDGAGDIRFINDQEKNPEFEFDYIEKTVLKLEQLLKVGREDSLSDFINELYESSTPENANLLFAQILATVYRVVSSVADKSELMTLLSENPIFARLTSYNSETVMKNDLLDFCENARGLVSQSQKRDTEILCDRVMQIIEENYSDETLSLTDVANMLSVSPNYLSALIKKVKKKNFITLLTERRMTAAHDMLVYTGVKILEVAERCGYSDQHYFSYCFKKFYGESPSKVRSLYRPEE